MRREDFADGCVFEGLTSIRAVIESGSRKIVRLMCDESRADARSKELGWLRHRADEMHLTVELVPTDEFESQTTGSSHGGLAALCGERAIPALGGSVPDGSFFVMLEGIEDPYNFGYTIRSLYAAGVDAVILSPRNWMTAAGVVCRSSAGASERIPMFTADSAARAAEYFKANGCRVVCADINNSVPVQEADLSKPIFLAVGGEKRGLSRAALDQADAVVRLDYGRAFPEALSAASAASILAYQVFLRNAPVK